MSCRKGVWKFDTLWEHPLGKGEATCHSSLCTSYAQRIRGRLLQEVLEEVENTLLIAEGNLVCDHPVSQYSIGLRTYYFRHHDDVSDQC